MSGAANSTCTISLTFTLSASGTRSATLTDSAGNGLLAYMNIDDVTVSVKQVHLLSTSRADRVRLFLARKLPRRAFAARTAMS